MAKQVQPLTDAERLSWNAHKERFDQFAASAKWVLISLWDCKKRELYREEYGDGKKGWESFLLRSPWFKTNDMSRQARSDFKKAVEMLEELSVTTDNQLLEQCTKNELLTLRNAVPDPVMRQEIAQLLKKEGKTITEDNIDRAHLRIKQQHEAEVKQSKDECGMELKIAEVCTEEEADEEPEGEAPPADEAAIQEAEKQSRKRSNYLGRTMDNGRLFVKNGDKIEVEDLVETEDRAALLEQIIACEGTCKRLRKMIRAEGGVPEMGATA